MTTWIVTTYETRVYLVEYRIEGYDNEDDAYDRARSGKIEPTYVDFKDTIDIERHTVEEADDERE